MATGALLPPACRAWICPECGPARMWRMARALDSAGYDRWVTVTNTPADWLQGMARLAHRVRRDYGEWEWAFVRELGPDNGMSHVHAVVRGPYVPHTRFRRLAVAAGFGRVVWIAKPTAAGGVYAAKSAGYCAKAAGGYLETLELNRGRPWHWSRGYAPGLTPLQFMTRHAPGKDPGPWVRVPWYELAEGRALHERRELEREAYLLEALPTVRAVATALVTLGGVAEHVAAGAPGGGGRPGD